MCTGPRSLTFLWHPKGHIYNTYCILVDITHTALLIDSFVLFKHDNGNRRRSIGHCPHLWNPPQQPIHHSQQNYCFCRVLFAQTVCITYMLLVSTTWVCGLFQTEARFRYARLLSSRYTGLHVKRCTLV